VKELQLESPKYQSNFAFLIQIVNNRYKPLNINKATPMKIQDDSLNIADECKIDELPSFNLPKNSAVSGTGKKQGRFTRDYDLINTPFKYHARSKVVFNNSASPSRPSWRFTNKFSFLKSNTNLVTPQKKQIVQCNSFESGPSFKKKKPSEVKPISLKPNNSEIWNETENDSDYYSSQMSINNRDTPNFGKSG
jgi:hypothetical protein